MSVITDIAQLDPNGTYSYADYLKWQFEERVELFGGKIFPMSPSPSLRHQQISVILSGQFYSFFRLDECRLYSAPVDVWFYNRKKPDKVR